MNLCFLISPCVCQSRFSCTFCWIILVDFFLQSLASAFIAIFIGIHRENGVDIFYIPQICIPPPPPTHQRGCKQVCGSGCFGRIRIWIQSKHPNSKFPLNRTLFSTLIDKSHKKYCYMLIIFTFNDKEKGKKRLDPDPMCILTVGSQIRFITRGSDPEPGQLHPDPQP